MARISMHPPECQNSQSTDSEIERPTETDHYRFTPRPMIKKSTRLWDRKPATPFNARSKSHKIWKRFNTSDGITGSKINSTTVDVDMTDSSEEILVEEINLANGSGQLRYVKKMCVRRGVKSIETDWEISFLETKLDTEVFAGRRKAVVKREIGEDYEMVCVDTSDTTKVDPLSNCNIEEQKHAKHNQETLVETTEILQGLTTPSKKQTKIMDDEEEKILRNNAMGCEDAISPVQELDVQASNAFDIKIDFEISNDPQSSHDNHESENFEDHYAQSKVLSGSDEMTSSDSIEAPATPTKESSAITSIFRRPIIEGDDAELFSNFLSEAQAKRDANNALAIKNATATRATIPVPQTPPKYKSRQALETLDKNSPSSAIRQVSLSKSLPPLASPLVESGQENELELGLAKEEDEDENEALAPSPHKRGRPSRKRVTPRVTDQIPLRRSDGTEFIFLQKTEAQQLALTTKTNTKRNKGDSKLPRMLLKTINAVFLEGALQESPEPQKPAKKGAKSVTWNDQNLVSFAEESTTPVFDSPDMTPGRRSSRRLASIAPQPSIPLRSPVPRKMRRLGAVKAQLIDKDALERVQVMTPPTIGATPLHHLRHHPSSAASRPSTKSSLLSLDGTTVGERKKLTPLSRKIKDSEGDGGEEKGRGESKGVRKTSLQRLMVKLG